jgi:hypothetical protein
MIVDGVTFSDLALHVHLASNAVARLGRVLDAYARNIHDTAARAAVFEALLTLGGEVSTIDEMLRAVSTANREERGEDATKASPC